MRPSSRLTLPSGKAWTYALWVPVLAGVVIMGLALGVRHVQGLFLLPVTLDRGWSREMFGFALAFQNLTWGIAQPFTSMIADRFGTAKIVVGGLVFYALGLYFMIHAHTSTALLLSAGICIGIALSGTAFGAIYGALSRIVPPERRSWALGAGPCRGDRRVQPVRDGSSDAGDDRDMAMDRRCAGAGDYHGGRPAAGLADARSARSSRDDRSRHFPPRCDFRGVPAPGLLAAQSRLSRLRLPTRLHRHAPSGLPYRPGPASQRCSSRAGDHSVGERSRHYLLGLWGGLMRRKHLLAGLYLVRTLAIALFVMLPLSPWSVYAFAAVIGFLWLGTVPLTNGIVSQIFGVRYITTLFGFVFFGHQLGSFFGVWLGGYVFEATGSYQGMWLLAMALGLLAAIVHWPIDDRTIIRPFGRVAPA